MDRRPNLIFMMPDQLRADFLSCYGASFIETPNIDALAAHGVRFERAYSEHPVCVPARAALITGMNAIKAGVLDNGQFVRPDYQDCGIRTWPEVLNEHGYETVATGKMHFYPWEKRFGFGRRIVAEDKLWCFIQDDYHHFLEAAGYHKTDFVDQPDYHENFSALISPFPWEYTVDHFVGQASVDWIEAYDGEEPFAMMVGFPGPHSPYDPASEYATFDPEAMPEPLSEVPEDTELMRVPPSRSVSGRRAWYAVRNEGHPGREHFMLHRAYYAGLVKQIDHEVGCIVEALRKKGILENTVILFSSDHGDYLGDHGLQGKGSYYEAACHVPFLVRHPDMEAGVVRQDLVTLTDVIATMLSLAGCAVPGYMDSVPLPGLDLPDSEGREHIVGVLRNGWMLFDGTWKLCKYAGGGVHLFNLEEDPEEQHNRAQDNQCADVLRQMEAILTATMMRFMDEARFDQRVYTFSHSSNPDFGRPGWDRTYPMPWQRIYGD